jgi:serine/threonine protein kinase
MLMKPNYDFFNDDILKYKIDNIEDECEFKGFLGQGSFGVVHKVLYRRTNPLMAMKIIDLRGLPPDQRSSSILELMILAKCNHSNIVEFIGFDYTEKKIWILLELLDMSLEEYISENKLDMKQIRNILKLTIDALSYLKETFEITHRDIKPSNILVDRKLTKIKLSDFGTVKFLSNFRNTTKVTVRGTLVFMAPEMRQVKEISFFLNITLI